MITCIDTCCLINLINSGLLPRIVAATGRSFQFQGLVEDELVSHRAVVESLVKTGLLTRISGAGFSASEVGAIALRHNIGVGESECIAICLKTGVLLASDDRRARNAGISELSKNRVTGSIGLLRDTVQSGLIEAGEAAEAVICMRSAGAFVPNLGSQFFQAP